MGGAFDASAEFDDDELATADEIQESGQRALRTLGGSRYVPGPVDFKLVKEIHFRWFETTFPADAGEFRTEMAQPQGHRSRGRGDPPGDRQRVRKLELAPGEHEACGRSGHLISVAGDSQNGKEAGRCNAGGHHPDVAS